MYGKSINDYAQYDNYQNLELDRNPSPLSDFFLGENMQRFKNFSAAQSFLTTLSDKEKHISGYNVFSMYNVNPLAGDFLSGLQDKAGKLLFGNRFGTGISSFFQQMNQGVLGATGFGFKYVQSGEAEGGLLRGLNLIHDSKYSKLSAEAANMSSVGQVAGFTKDTISGALGLSPEGNLAGLMGNYLGKTGLGAYAGHALGKFAGLQDTDLASATTLGGLVGLGIAGAAHMGWTKRLDKGSKLLAKVAPHAGAGFVGANAASMMGINPLIGAGAGIATSATVSQLVKKKVIREFAAKGLSNIAGKVIGAGTGLSEIEMIADVAGIANDFRMEHQLEYLKEFPSRQLGKLYNSTNNAMMNYHGRYATNNDNELNFLLNTENLARAGSQAYSAYK